MEFLAFMNKKRILILVVALALVAGFYFQFRQWRSFDWATFWSQARQLHWLRVAAGIGFIFLGYIFRAIRWKLFLQPVRPRVSVGELISPTIIGFAAMAVLGRAGEAVRPYLIARRTDLPVSSQLAAWAVERIFDVGAFTVLLAVAVFGQSTFGQSIFGNSSFGELLAQPALATGPHAGWYAGLRGAVLGLVGLVVGITVGAAAVHYKGESIAGWVEKEFGHLSANFGHRMAQWVREFGIGLNTIHGPMSLVWLSLTSLGMWFVIALSYHEVTRSYGTSTLAIAPLQIMVLMGSSMLGSILALPAVGGGSQLATIRTLSSLFDVPPEMAASCGIMLWLVSFASVVPVGLILAQRERLSFRELSEESHRAEEEVIVGEPPAA